MKSLFAFMCMPYDWLCKHILMQYVCLHKLVELSRFECAIKLSRQRCRPLAEQIYYSQQFTVCISYRFNKCQSTNRSHLVVALWGQSARSLVNVTIPYKLWCIAFAMIILLYLECAYRRATIPHISTISRHTPTQVILREDCRAHSTIRVGHALPVKLYIYPLLIWYGMITNLKLYNRMIVTNNNTSLEWKLSNPQDYISNHPHSHNIHIYIKYIDAYSQ